jgi:hypothetical protein
VPPERLWRSLQRGPHQQARLPRSGGFFHPRHGQQRNGGNVRVHAHPVPSYRAQAGVSVKLSNRQATFLLPLGRWKGTIQLRRRVQRGSGLSAGRVVSRTLARPPSAKPR